MSHSTDKFFTGFKRGEFILSSSHNPPRPSTGKSNMALNIAMKAALANHKPGDPVIVIDSIHPELVGNVELMR